MCAVLAYKELFTVIVHLRWAFHLHGWHFLGSRGCTIRLNTALIIIEPFLLLSVSSKSVATINRSLSVLPSHGATHGWQMGCVGSTLAWLAICKLVSRCNRLQQCPLVRGTGEHAFAPSAEGREGQHQHPRGSLGGAAVVFVLLCCSTIEQVMLVSCPAASLYLPAHPIMPCRR
jgi:hypothetical protein